MGSWVWLLGGEVYISNWVWSGYFSEICFFLYHVFSVVLRFKEFYNSSLAFPCFRFLYWWRKTMCVCKCWCTPVCRQGYGRDGGWSKCCGPLGLSLVHRDRWYPFVFRFRQACFFSWHGSSELGKFRKGFHMSQLSNISRKILFFCFHGNKARQWEKGSHSPNSRSEIIIKNISQNQHQCKSGEENLF